MSFISNLFTILATLLSFIVVIGLIKPKLVLFWYKTQTRPYVALFFVVPMFGLIFLSTATEPESEKIARREKEKQDSVKTAIARVEQVKQDSINEIEKEKKDRASRIKMLVSNSE